MPTYLIEESDTSPKNDPVKSPNHYMIGGIEVKDILKAKLSPEELRGYYKANIIKYILRAEFKGTPAIDYAKAAEYARWLTEETGDAK